MDDLKYLIGLGEMAYSAAFILWFISLPLAIFVTFSTVAAVSRNGKVMRNKAWLLWFHLAPVLCLVIGTVFQDYGPGWPDNLLLCILAGVVVSAICFVIYSRGVRLAIASHFLVVIWFTFLRGLYSKHVSYQ